MKSKILKFVLVLTPLIMLFVRVQAQEKGDPPAPMPGLEIKRSYLIKQMQAADSSLVFNPANAIEGEQNIIGVDKDGSSLQFVGDEDYLKKAAFTFKFTTNHEVNLLQYKRMAYFAFLMGNENGVKWLEECAAQFINNKEKVFTSSKNFDFNRKGIYTYNPNDKAIVLTFTEW